MEKNNLHAHPLTQFGLWFVEAQKVMSLPEAFCLATADANGHPDARMLLLKGVDSGFVFYTNLNSVKGSHLKTNPQVAMTWYWDALKRQVRVKGCVESVTDAEADAYFSSRPRDSQIGAWASFQSQELQNRAQLEERFDTFEKKFDAQKIPRPPHWSGFRVLPQVIEFWQEQPNRLHDRFQYALSDSVWEIRRLSP